VYFKDQNYQQKINLNRKSVCTSLLKQQIDIVNLFYSYTKFLHINIRLQKRKQCHNAIFKDCNLQFKDFQLLSSNSSVFKYF